MEVEENETKTKLCLHFACRCELFQLRPRVRRKLKKNRQAKVSSVTRI